MLLEAAQTGDTVLTLEVSRLSRSAKQLCEIVEAIKQKHLRLIDCITIDCRKGERDAISAAFLQMAGVFAELELQMIRARVKSGMANAKSKGKRVGRPVLTKETIPPVFLKHLAAYREGELNVSELARVCGVSRPTVYKYLKMVE